jgi:hypothetical protein
VREVVGLVVAGGLLGTLLDALHATTRYTQPTIAGLAWWAPLLFAGASLAIGFSHSLSDLLLGRDVRPDAGRVGMGLALLLVL